MYQIYQAESKQDDITGLFGKDWYKETQDAFMANNRVRSAALEQY